MRTVTEALHFEGIYVDSTKAKRINRTVSKRAAELMALSTKKDYPKLTVLEHTLPLKAMYNELLVVGQQFTFEDVKAHFRTKMRECPLVTVTLEENDLLVNHLLPADRYLTAGIEIGVVEEMTFGSTPVWTRLATQLKVVPDDPETDDDQEAPLTKEVQEVGDRRGHMSWGPGDIEFLK
ncbi:hypothetical protein [Mesorhizobium sp. M0091]|uniref:hypothetical protein n=1 Tax=Mesorhizobium sp. M0091 TaxID=2956875 RepID=UPI00333BE309